MEKEVLDAHNGAFYIWEMSNWYKDVPQLYIETILFLVLFVADCRQKAQ